MAWYNRITIHLLTNTRNKYARPLPMGYQPNATAEDILTESNRMILAEFEKPETRNVSQYKSLITWATKAINNVFDEVGKTITCRPRSVDIAEAIIECSLTQLRQPVEGTAQCERPGNRRSRQATQEFHERIQRTRPRGDTGAAPPPEDQTQTRADVPSH